MTILVGVLCKDGVVIGADSAASFGVNPQFKTIEQPYPKIDVIDDSLIVACTGAIGLAQRFGSVVKNEWDKKTLQGKTAVEIGKILSARGIEDISATHIPINNIGFGALVAFPSAGKANLVEFETEKFQPELKTEKLWYVSTGSGQLIGDPFLGLIRKVFWKDGPPSCQDAKFAVAWTLL